MLGCALGAEFLPKSLGIAQVVDVSTLLHFLIAGKATTFPFNFLLYIEAFLEEMATLSSVIILLNSMCIRISLICQFRDLWLWQGEGCWGVTVRILQTQLWLSCLLWKAAKGPVRLRPWIPKTIDVLLYLCSICFKWRYKGFWSGVIP